MDLRDELVAAYADDAVYTGILAYPRAPSDETLGALSRKTRNQITLTVICCATASPSSMPLESSCPTTSTYDL
ncbi:hypothetical protein PF008_g388 [Phytophthora fragariae]|uniref:Uncharacterized protein n=1 Tax=Phytophthora fragariae TaxID=53985 RepID=A0A6G0SNV1_9STRA|nr:hypothetical protein PF008_g388 [Phytophthora fragariae]